MNQEEEKLLDDLEKELASVDTHYLFAMGPGGTVFRQIFEPKLKHFITEHFISKEAHENELEAIIKMTSHEDCISRKELEEILAEIKKYKINGKNMPKEEQRIDNLLDEIYDDLLAKLKDT